MKKRLNVQIVEEAPEAAERSNGAAKVETGMSKPLKGRCVRGNNKRKGRAVQEPGGGGQDAFAAETAEAKRQGSRNEYKEHLAAGQTAHRILIVEDQEGDWQLMHRRLCQAGFQVRVALNGAEGVEAFRKWRPQFIWMDCRMPVMDGLEATRRIRALEGGRDVKIVILSASVLRKEREAAWMAGADDIAAKPMRLGRVYDYMNKHLGAQFTVDAPSSVWETEPPVAVDHEALAALPWSLRMELADALVSLDRMTQELVGRSCADPKTVTAVPEPAERINQNALAALPSSLRTELADALAGGDEARIAVCIRRVAGLNPSLGDFLEHQGGRFGYAFVLNAVQGSPGAGLKVEAA